ncbi:unnamed protein product, partial [Protopolystoma xenopodis]
MAMLSQNEIISRTKTSVLALESLKNEQALALDGLKAQISSAELDKIEKEFIEEKTPPLSSLLDRIQCSIDEAGAEKQKLKYQGRRLYQENVWLRDELTKSHEEFRLSEQKVVLLESQVKQLEFTAEMRKYDVPESADSTAPGDGSGEGNEKTAAD